MSEGARLFSSFSFWLDKGMLRWGDNFWSGFLHLIVLVVKAFSTSGNAVVRTCSKNRGRSQFLGQHESSCHGYYIIHGLAAFSSFAEHGLHTYTLPPPRWAHIDSPKNGKQTRWAAKEASKAFYGYLRAGVRGKSDTVHLLSWNEWPWSCLILDTQALWLVHGYLTPLEQAAVPLTQPIYS